MKYLHKTLDILIVASAASTIVSFATQHADAFAYSFVAFLVSIGLTMITQPKTE